MEQHRGAAAQAFRPLRQPPAPSRSADAVASRCRAWFRCATSREFFPQHANLAPWSRFATIQLVEEGGPGYLGAGPNAELELST